jgi:hypothetical protein
MVTAYFFMLACIVVAIISVTIFARRNGQHLAYPLWQFTALILVSMFSIYGAVLSTLYMILR